jgi:hypothetical protein
VALRRFALLHLPTALLAQTQFEVRLPAALQNTIFAAAVAFDHERELVVDPLGWSHAIVGPFTANTARDLDLRTSRDRFFRLQGIVRAATGLPAAGAAVEGTLVRLPDEERTRRLRTQSLADGTFTLWSNRPFTELRTKDGSERALRVGPFAGDAVVDIDERQHGYVVVRGRVVDGGPTAIYGATARPKPPHREAPDGMTDEAGAFTVRVPRHQTHLWFCRERGNREAWVAIEPGTDLEVQLEG